MVLVQGGAHALPVYVGLRLTLHPPIAGNTLGHDLGCQADVPAPVASGNATPNGRNTCGG